MSPGSSLTIVQGSSFANAQGSSLTIVQGLSLMIVHGSSLAIVHCRDHLCAFARTIFDDYVARMNGVTKV